jgi:hypothetical protein
MLDEYYHIPILNANRAIEKRIGHKVHFADRAFRNLDEVEATLCQGLNDHAKDPEKLRSMTSFPYLNITC